MSTRITQNNAREAGGRGSAETRQRRAETSRSRGHERPRGTLCAWTRASVYQFQSPGGFLHLGVVSPAGTVCANFATWASGTAFLRLSSAACTLTGASPPHRPARVYRPNRDVRRSLASRSHAPIRNVWGLGPTSVYSPGPARQNNLVPFLISHLMSFAEHQHLSYAALPVSQ